MAQADYVISPNPTGLAMREEINQIFQAALTSNSGSTAPTTTAPYSMWVDTSNGTTHYLKMRNHTDDAWISIASYDVASKTIKPTSLINTSTDNAIVRFDGTTGAVQNSGIIIDDGINIGVGVTPSAWITNAKAIELGFNGNSIWSDQLNEIFIGSNWYYSSTGFKYANTGYLATHYKQLNGAHQWYTAPSGTSGNAITWTNVMTLNASGNLLLQSGTGGLGYGTGAGGTVTQLTSKSTAVTLNKPTGQITMNNAALAAGASVGFNLNNNLISGNQDLLSITTGGASNYDISYSCGTGIAFILVKNKSAGSLSEALIINFAVIKGATA